MVRNWDLLKGRHFLKLLDYTPEEIEYLLDLAADLKERKKKGGFKKVMSLILALTPKESSVACSLSRFIAISSLPSAPPPLP